MHPYHFLLCVNGKRDCKRPNTEEARKKKGGCLNPVLPEGFLLNLQPTGLGCIDSFPAFNTDSDIRRSEGA